MVYQPHLRGGAWRGGATKHCRLCVKCQNMQNLPNVSIYLPSVSRLTPHWPLSTPFNIYSPCPQTPFFKTNSLSLILSYLTTNSLPITQYRHRHLSWSPASFKNFQLTQKQQRRIIQFSICEQTAKRVFNKWEKGMVIFQSQNLALQGWEDISGYMPSQNSRVISHLFEARLLNTEHAK